MLFGKNKGNCNPKYVGTYLQACSPKLNFQNVKLSREIAIAQHKIMHFFTDKQCLMSVHSM